jgi:hypothetical protein
MCSIMIIATWCEIIKWIYLLGDFDSEAEENEFESVLKAWQEDEEYPCFMRCLCFTIKYFFWILLAIIFIDVIAILLFLMGDAAHMRLIYDFRFD